MQDISNLEISYYAVPGLIRKPKVMTTPEQMIYRGYKAVLIAHGVTESEFKGKSRFRRLVYARHNFSYWAVNNTKLTLNEIGRLMGSRDHSTVIHGKRTWDDLLTCNDSLATMLHDKFMNTL